MTEFTDAQLKIALAQSFGIQAHAAEKLGVTRSAVNQRMTKEMREYVDTLEETLVDAAELVVAEALLKKDRGMAKWALAHHKKAKARGWGQKLEVGGPGGGSIPIAGSLKVTVEYVDPTPDPGDVV